MNRRDSSGSTPLIGASRNGDLAVLELLINNGAKINIRGRLGLTALHYAAWEHLEIVIMLLDSGADVSRKDASDSTALDDAIYFGNKEIIRVLVLAELEVTN